MAHFAAAAARSRFANSRASSPNDDNTFATATATSFRNAIHSTPQREYNPSEDDVPLHYDQYQEPSEHGSDGSADMSIEIGRGVKRGARRDNEFSSDIVFNFGNDNNQYEVMGTPPVRSRGGQSKPEGALRKEASVRRATESARANEATRKNNTGSKQRAVSDNTYSKTGQQPGAAAVRTSRFVSSRHAAANFGAIPTRFTADGGLEAAQQSPRQPAQGNVTVQSAVHTVSQSFMLPDLPDITNIVAGVRRDGTHLVKRDNAVRSRFASATYRPFTQDHATIEGIPLPEDEKAIFVSLEHAREKNARLEASSSEAQKRIEELEVELAELRNQLHIANRRPDSALGSEDDTLDGGGFQTDKARLQGKVAALQERLSKSERKISVAEITSTRVVKERDSLVTQIAAVYFQNEELSNENEELRASQAEFARENDDLKQTVEGLQDENARLKNMRRAGEDKSVSAENRRSEGRNQQETDRPQRTRSSKQSREAVRDGTGDEYIHRCRSSDHQDSTFARDLASRIEHEVRKMRESAASGTETHSQEDRAQHPGSARPRSRSNTRNASIHEKSTSLKRHISAPAEVEGTALGSRTARNAPQSVNEAIVQEDLTELSVLDPDDVANLRRKLEDEKRSGRLRNRASSSADAQADNTARSLSRHSMPRKSSLKDLTGGIDSGTGRFSLHGDDVSKVAKTVRVQSPHSSQDIFEPELDAEMGSTSMLSNTSRRRRRTSNTEGMTSAFIVPDITLQIPTNLGNACINHDAASCTICQGDKDMTIPKPVPVSERDVGDVTNATIRPSQPPEDALATVIKNMQDEVDHLKLQRDSWNRLYNQHDPAISKRRRQDLKAKIDILTAELERRSNQLYSLHDVLEGQKQQAQAFMAKGEPVKPISKHEIEETLSSIGIDPVHLSGHVGRKVPIGLESGDEMSDESEMGWEGISNAESEEEFHGFGGK